MIIKKGFIKNLIKSRSFIHGIPSMIIMAIVIAISIIVMILVDSVFTYKLDLTKDKTYSISQQTIDVLKTLDKEITIYKLFDDADISNYGTSEKGLYVVAMNLLDNYKNYTNKLKIVNIDPDKDPQLISNLDPDGSKNIVKGDIIFQNDKNVKKVSVASDSNLDQNSNFIIEQTFTSAIMQVKSGVVPKVYYTNGHGEESIDNNYRYLKLGFDNNGFELKPLINLSTQGIPKDAAMILVLSPKSDLTPDETHIIKDYLLDGGKGAFLFDPVTSIPDSTFNGFNEVLREYNLAINNSIIYEKDANNRLSGKEEELYLKIATNAVFDAIKSGDDLNLLFSKATEIDMLKNGQAETNYTSWVSTSNKAESRPIKSGLNSKIGSFPIIVTSEYTMDNVKSRIFVTANSTFISDKSISITSYQIPMMIFGGLTNWVQGEKTDLVIPGKSGEIEALNITESVGLFIEILLLVFIPLLIILIGIIVWARRRHL